MAKNGKNPCIDVCKIDKGSGLCRGCLRSKAEIKGWKDFKKKERRAINADLAHRSID